MNLLGKKTRGLPNLETSLAWTKLGLPVRLPGGVTSRPIWNHSYVYIYTHVYKYKYKCKCKYKCKYEYEYEYKYEYEYEYKYEYLYWLISNIQAFQSEIHIFICSD
jgi:hypothetical protein